MINLIVSEFLENVSIDRRNRNDVIKVGVMRFISLAHPIPNNRSEDFVRS
jgi:hypothetical protein